MPLNLSVTDSLELRQISEDDAFELTGLIDRNRRYLKEWLPWLDRNTNVEDTARFIGSSQEQALDNNGLTFGIVFEGALAGVIAEVYLDSGNRRTELGYWLADDHQGRGIVTRAAARLTDYAFYEQDCHRVVIHCAAGNLKSRAVAERLGFLQEGLLREAEWLYDHYVDLVIYSMLKMNWITPPAGSSRKM